jgi:hypothetical protein
MGLGGIGGFGIGTGPYLGGDGHPTYAGNPKSHTDNTNNPADKVKPPFPTNDDPCGAPNKPEIGPSPSGPEKPVPQPSTIADSNSILLSWEQSDLTEFPVVRWHIKRYRKDFGSADWKSDLGPSAGLPPTPSGIDVAPGDADVIVQGNYVYWLDTHSNNVTPPSPDRMYDAAYYAYFIYAVGYKNNTTYINKDAINAYTDIIGPTMLPLAPSYCENPTPIGQDIKVIQHANKKNVLILLKSNSLRSPVGYCYYSQYSDDAGTFIPYDPNHKLNGGTNLAYTLGNVGLNGSSAPINGVPFLSYLQMTTFSVATIHGKIFSSEASGPYLDYTP